MPSAPNEKKLLLKRLRGYWKIERLNIFLLPTVAVLVVKLSFQVALTPAFVLSLFTTSWMLIIGTIALRMLLKTLEGDSAYGEFWLPYLSWAQIPSVILLSVSASLTTFESYLAFANLTAAQYAAIMFTVLAWLEYVNFYHRQLQHFDHGPDIRRFLAGQGFRRSHLSRALQKWRSRNRRTRRFLARQGFRRSHLSRALQKWRSRNRR
jgi:hypothetical protein